MKESKKVFHKNCAFSVTSKQINKTLRKSKYKIELYEQKSIVLPGVATVFSNVFTFLCYAELFFEIHYDNINATVGFPEIYLHF